jgi:glycine/D-amino acid oxidase-like deaminating enzyme
MAAWERIERDAGEPIVRRLGNLVYSTIAAYPALEAQATGSEAAGGVIERLDRAGMRSRFPQFRAAAAGVFEPAAGFVRASAAVGALCRLARTAGIEVLENTPVARLDLDAERPAAVLADGSTLTADRVIVAAGVWSPRLVPQLRPVITLQLVGNAFIAGLPAAFDEGTLPPFSVAETNFYGFPQSAGQRVKIGWHNGGEVVSDPDTDRTAATRFFLDAVDMFLEAHFGLRVPASAIQGVSCMYDVTPTTNFLIDYVPGSRRLFVVTGGSGHGFKFGSIVGRLALDRLEGVAGSWPPQFAWAAASGT